MGASQEVARMKIEGKIGKPVSETKTHVLVARGGWFEIFDKASLPSERKVNHKCAE
jgi:hypothetical protein